MVTGFLSLCLRKDVYMGILQRKICVRVRFCVCVRVYISVCLYVSMCIYVCALLH